MRIQCPGCDAAYDVAGRPTGTLVSCHCGETFGFPQPPAGPVHLRCPGCGAQADPATARCPYCDLALKTVCCPNCFALMAGDDRHCTRCGMQVSAPALSVHRHGAPTLPCPRCSTAMTANLIGNHLFDRCDGCGGIWAHHLAVAAVFAERGQRVSVADWLEHLSLPASSRTDVSGPAVCPDCEQPMQRHGVERHRELQVDVCGDHGVWFDFRELRTVADAAAGSRRRSQRKGHRRVRQRRNLAAFLDELDDWWPFEAIEELLDFLEDLLD